MLPDNDFLTIYPNPASGSFTLELNDDQNADGTAEIELFNTVGQSVLRLKDEMLDGHLDKVIDLKKLSGLHIVKVKVNGKTYDSKLMVN